MSRIYVCSFLFQKNWIETSKGRQMILKIDVYTSYTYISRCEGNTPLFMLELTSMDMRIIAQLRTWILTPKFCHCLTNRWRRGRNCGDQFPGQSWSLRDASRSCPSPPSRCSGRLETGSGRRTNTSWQLSHWFYLLNIMIWRQDANNILSVQYLQIR